MPLFKPKHKKSPEMTPGKPSRPSVAAAIMDKRKKMPPGSPMEHDHDEKCYAHGGDVCRMGYAQGGEVEGEAGYLFDIHDEIEHPNYYEPLNAEIADEKLYEDDYGPDPKGSNEKGRKLADEDEHGRRLFKKIKMKKAQPGDRGKY